MEYRICKNKYGYYKIQKKVKKWYGKYRWEDFPQYGYVNRLFETKKEALDTIERYIERDKRNNNDWECEGEYF